MGVEVEVEDTGATKLIQSFGKLANAVTIGVHDDAEPYEDGTSVSTVFAVHEFGTATVPQRSIVRGYIDSGGAVELAKVGEEAIGKIVDGRLTPRLAAELVGETAVKGILKRMDAGIFPPLAESTLKNPKRDPRGIPLEDTDRLRNSITFKVNE